MSNYVGSTSYRYSPDNWNKIMEEIGKVEGNENQIDTDLEQDAKKIFSNANNQTKDALLDIANKSKILSSYILKAFCDTVSDPGIKKLSENQKARQVHDILGDYLNAESESYPSERWNKVMTQIGMTEEDRNKIDTNLELSAQKIFSCASNIDKDLFLERFLNKKNLTSKDLQDFICANTSDGNLDENNIGLDLGLQTPTAIDFPQNDKNYGTYHVDGLAKNKQSIVKAAWHYGASLPEISYLLAIANQETEAMNSHYPEGDNKDGLSFNVSPFKMSIDQIQEIETYSGNPLSLNDPDHIGLAVKIMLDGMRKFGIDDFLDFHRGGRSGYDHTYSPWSDIQAYKETVSEVAHKYFNEPDLRINNQRVNTYVKPI